MALKPRSERFEIVLVDDRCSMVPWEIIEQLAADEDCVVSIRLSRNFGQLAAIYVATRAEMDAIIAIAN